MDEGIAVEGDGPPLVEVTIRLWSLDPDTCEEEIGWRWSERQDGSDLELFRLLHRVIGDHIRHQERREKRGT